ncbi:MAG TPA: hypothetical protein VL527_10165 [Dongiaceae bacterium]|nr:hypothetical protein [Dongiaceae bacterium]
MACVGISALVVGCVNTVDGNKRAAFPFLKDRVEARYERPVDQVVTAAKEVLAYNGTIDSTGQLFNQTNEVRVLEGKVKQRTVWIRVEAVDPRVTGLTVQVRTSGGTSDLDLAHELDKEIALKLVR